MKRLKHPSVPLDFDRAFYIDCMLAEKLQSKGNLKSIVPEIKIDWFLNAGQEALSELVPRGLISVEVRRRLEKYFETVTKLSPRSEPVLCHGDFGPKNIMLDKATPIVIDWEVTVISMCLLLRTIYIG